MWIRTYLIQERAFLFFFLNIHYIYNLYVNRFGELMLDQITDLAIRTAKEAGEILREGFRTSFKVTSKSGKNNLVTEYDKRSEDHIINEIKREFPTHSFLAEESGKTGNIEKGKVLWVIDPLDGTVNYAHSLPIFSVSIAAVLDGEILCGVIYHPILDELFHATKGGGAFRNGELIHVSDNDDYERSMLVTGFPYNVKENPCHCIDHFVSVIQMGIPVRRLGSAALDLAYTAAGIFDGFWEVNLNPWDVAAGVILVQEAGGRVTEYSLEKHSIFSETILATNGRIHNSISRQLTQCHC
jgi:myo-inositol-1(or 4)-monophosphatase